MKRLSSAAALISSPMFRRQRLLLPRISQEAVFLKELFENKSFPPILDFYNKDITLIYIWCVVGFDLVEGSGSFPLLQRCHLGRSEGSIEILQPFGLQDEGSKNSPTPQMVDKIDV